MRLQPVSDKQKTSRSLPVSLSKALVCAAVLAGWAQAQIVVSHKSLSGSAPVNEIKPELKVKNNGTAAVDLSKVAIDYLVQEEGISAGSLVASCYYSNLVACQQVLFDVGSIAQRVDGSRLANTRIRISFAQGSLGAGQELDIQWGLHGQGWSHRFVESDDWSFTAADGQWHEAPYVEFDGSGSAGAQTPMVWSGSSVSLPTTATAGKVKRVSGADATYVHDGTSWQVLVKGVRGPAGDKGDRGPIGPQGDPGATGAKGLVGLKGAMGPSGAIGAQGPVGDKGVPGQNGLPADLTTQKALVPALKEQVKAATSARLADAVSEVSIGLGSLFLRPDGTVWVCGQGMGKYVGATGDLLVPTRIPNLDGVIQIASGFEHLLFLKSDGTLFGMGSNLKHQLGGGVTGDQATIPRTILTGVNAVFAGGNTTIARRNDNALYATGENGFGLTGVGHVQMLDVFTKLPRSALQVSIGEGSALFLEVDGTLRGCGRNSEGQLGDKTTTDRLAPVRVQVPGTVTSMATAGAASIVLQTDGQVFVMGNSLNGAIGAGDPSGQAISTPVKVGTDGIGVVTTGSASFIVNRRNELWATGENNQGDFGTGNTRGFTSFTRLHADRKFLSVTCHPASGTFYRLVDGNVMAAGMNLGGSLGTGGTASFETTLKDVIF